MTLARAAIGDVARGGHYTRQLLAHLRQGGLLDSERSSIRRLAACQHAATLLAGDIDERQHAVAMVTRGQRSHCRRWIERVADLDRAAQCGRTSRAPHPQSTHA
jgi:hypothetical protein